MLEETGKNNIDVLSNKMKKPWVAALLAWYDITVREDCCLIADTYEGEVGGSVLGQSSYLSPRDDGGRGQVGGEKGVWH